MVGKQEELSKIKTSVEMMNKFHQIGVLKLLSSKKDLTINENNNGVFINLSDLDDTVLKELLDYIQYVSEQESDLDHHEQEKEKYKSVFFDNTVTENKTVKKIKTISKENKDKDNNYTSKDDLQAELGQ